MTDNARPPETDSPVLTALRAELQTLTGEDVRLIRVLAGGHNADLYLVDMTGGERFVVKQARTAQTRMDLEGWMLRLLSEQAGMPIPRLYSVQPERLVMEYIPDGGGIDRNVQTDCAHILARLHSVSGPHYGLDRATPIGPFLQGNTPSVQWIPFFRDQRLLATAHKAYEEQVIDTALLNDIETLAGRLESLCDEPPAPALIHGDLWSGNILTRHGRVAAFIDPALYYADPEMELAFITLFRTFDERFFSIYEEHRALRPDFLTVRKDIYNLYPLLVHARLYRGGYINSVAGIVRRFV